ncbi:leukocyte immunoglobulin-like receptor subfamily B member 3 isoform X2 [Phyllostomus hastatus]|uniref:leukocyte immunoglobulin-like receptor subfamily B member 3 isoform X2 n=1 Tax=Phyllostomus hastatus TaxID=9423 RepID=UPI001E67F4A6|nr:leukocyte immunoglobulin-like receptor subfamily B member 3 isoform X2 [Phyllostomus hastatus]
MPPSLTALLCFGLSVGLRTPVQAGTLPKPTLWAKPGPVIPWGSSVTIWCQGALECRLYKEGIPVSWDIQMPLEPRKNVKFSITYMTEHTAGRYQCTYLGPTGWLECDDPLELVVTGYYYSKPSLSALPSPLVTSGGNVTLQCGSQQRFDRFILTKEGEHRLSWTLDSQQHASGQVQALFPLSTMIPRRSGTFRCYGCYRNRPQVCSQPSDALELLVSGWLRDRPSLSMQPGPTVVSGENVTLLCQSQSWRDSFLLAKEGEAHPPLHLRSQSQAQQQQAEFSMGPVTSAHGGTYRCYSSLNTFPYLLSQPSAPLELLISGPSGNPSPPPTGPTSTSAQGLQWNWNMLIGVLVALVLLLSLLLFFFLRHWCQSKGGTSGATELDSKDRGLQTRSNPAVDNQEEPLYAAMKDPQPGEGMELHPWQNRTHDDPQGETYAQVTSSRSRLRQGMAPSSSPLSEELLGMKDKQAEEDRQMDSQAAASAAPQDVTYAQLTHLGIRWETSAPPSSPSEQPPDEPSVYAALAIQ